MRRCVPRSRPVSCSRRASLLTSTHARPRGAHELGAILKRVLDIDIERCACGGPLKVIATIEDAIVIVRILTTWVYRPVRRRAPRRGRIRASTRPDLRTHDNISFAAELTNSLGLRLLSVLNVRRNDAVRDDVEAKRSSRFATLAGISVMTVRLTA